MYFKIRGGFFIWQFVKLELVMEGVAMGLVKQCLLCEFLRNLDQIQYGLPINTDLWWVPRSIAITTVLCNYKKCHLVLLTRSTECISIICASSREHCCSCMWGLLASLAQGSGWDRALLGWLSLWLAGDLCLAGTFMKCLCNSELLCLESQTVRLPQ